MDSDGKKKALIISISDYDKGLDQLEFCKNDGKKMYATLTKLGYEIQETQKIVGKADKKTMKTAIIFLKQGMSMILYYFIFQVMVFHMGMVDGFLQTPMLILTILK